MTVLGMESFTTAASDRVENAVTRRRPGVGRVGRTVAGDELVPARLAAAGHPDADGADTPSAVGDKIVGLHRGADGRRPRHRRGETRRAAA